MIWILDVPTNDGVEANDGEEDILVNENGEATSLASLTCGSFDGCSSPASTARITGVVTADYVADGNDELTCAGEVTLTPKAGRRKLESTTMKFSTRSAQTRALQNEAATQESEFSVGIQLDPNGGSSAAAAASISGVISMVLVAAASVSIYLF